MNRPLTILGRTAMVAGLMLACTVSEPVRAEEAPEPHPSLAPMHKSLIKIRGNIKNGRMRYEAGVVGFTPGADNSNPTPTELCCSSNLEKIQAGVDELHRFFDEIAVCYDDVGDLSSRSQIEIARQNLRNLERGRDEFAKATDSAMIKATIGAMTRAFNLLMEDVEPLEGCEQGKKGKKKKKR